ncbi:hypothetical protein F9L16_21270 [Agarivorans sp. B2Z047]|uniref:hypothetical protein n=1 Tax=Agarivorans sp. B2Z047 TaxID=2652721 RepID=UPI00128CEE3F|nr:hypothetical protein [Agarivorans sp. B2Z047]MPW31509.1 hypothetical protein [Agarivorans sp. B2Z047]UQN42552.1 hypothetical protein LQZ07_22700 [Agarivorans sp. B2Z047]
MKKLLVIAMVMVTSACSSMADRYDPDVHNSDESAVQVTRAVVLSVKQVRVKPSDIDKQGLHTGLAVATAGGLMAGAGRSENARDAGAALAVIGLVGAAIEANNNKEIEAFQYLVESNSGEVMEITQADEVALKTNSKVMITRYNTGRIKLTVDNTQGEVFDRTSETQYN